MSLDRINRNEGRLTRNNRNEGRRLTRNNRNEGRRLDRNNRNEHRRLTRNIGVDELTTSQGPYGWILHGVSRTADNFKGM